MEEIISFLTANWIPILLMITCIIYDPKYAMVSGIGFLIFGTQNLIFLWIIFVISILELGFNTASRVNKNTKKEATKTDHKWEM